MNESLISTIRERYERTLGQITQAATASGRHPHDVHLLVVSKSQPLEVLQASISAGITCFGENYAEEAVAKITAIGGIGVEWHMIGHVQSRKAGLVAGNFNMLHSLDSLKLAGRLDRFCAELNRTLPVLLEFNVSGEESKSGFPAWEPERWPELEAQIEQILDLPHLRVSGLMTMPPFYEDAERTRPYFKRLREVKGFLENRFPGPYWKELSMGTSVDFLAAVQEGATFVRVGQAILGPRLK
jgi:pyridoxal phosphate enzyme (YggS family)